MSLDRGFLTGPGLGGVLADAHLDTRDRMGRLLTFVARTVQDGWASVGAARGIGVGSAYFLSPTIAPTTCLPGQPLTFRNVIVQRLSGSGSFDLPAWSGARGAVAVYDISAEAGVLTSSQSGGSVY